MISDAYAKIGNNAAPLYDYDYTQEYLMRLRGASFIPVRKKADYKIKEEDKNKRNYLTPLMRSINNSRRTGRNI